jgi:hypothetical protein
VSDEPDAPWLVRYQGWQQRHPVLVGLFTGVALFGGGVAGGWRGGSVVGTVLLALEILSVWRWRAWLRERIHVVVTEHREIEARRIVARLAAVYRADIVRREIAGLVAEGYLDQADDGVLRPATLV